MDNNWNAILKNFASEPTLLILKQTLADILIAVDELEPNTAGLEQKLTDLGTAITTFQSAFDVRDLAKNSAIITLNTDLNTQKIDLKEKLDSVITAVNLLNTDLAARDLAKDSTLLSFKAEAKAISGEAVDVPAAYTTLDRLKQLKAQLVANASNDDANVALLTNAIIDVENKLEETRLVAHTLASRMKANQPDVGYSIWLDLADTDYLYVLEAPDAAVAANTGFRGTRVPKTVTGIVGKQQVNLGGTLTFNNRKTDGGWV